MILKKLKRTSFKKHKAVMISELVEYILAPEDEGGREKTVYAGARNFLAHTPGGRKAEMISLASESVQSKMPVTHWTLCWQENEQPCHEQIEEAVDVFLERMGLEGHQVIYALHGNTANTHLHIAVNRMNPDTLKVVQPHRGFDIEEAHKIVAYLQQRQGWANESNPRYMVNAQGEIVRNTGKPMDKPIIGPRDKAASFESATGEKSAQRIAQERGHGIIKNAASWADLHQKMADAGLRFEKKGSGGVVFVGDSAVKASSIDRAFGMGNLCKLLGDFESGDYAQEMPALEAEPVHEITAFAGEKWREYNELRAQMAMRRQEAKREATAALAAEKARHTPRRHSALARLAVHGFSMLNIARHFLKIQQQEELRRVRETLPTAEKPLPRFRTWLAGQTPRLVSLLKFHRRIASGIASGIATVKPEFPKTRTLPSPYRAYREMVKKRFPQPMDDSRRDAMIALWMRVTGYSIYEVANEMFHKARPPRIEKEQRDWKSYARKTAQYAFGTPGDMDIANAGLTPEKIACFIQEAERLEAALVAEMESTATPERKDEARPTSGLRMR